MLNNAIKMTGKFTATTCLRDIWTRQESNLGHKPSLRLSIRYTFLAKFFVKWFALNLIQLFFKDEPFPVFFIYFFVFSWFSTIQYNLKNLAASDNWTQVVGVEIQSADHWTATTALIWFNLSTQNLPILKTTVIATLERSRQILFQYFFFCICAILLQGNQSALISKPTNKHQNNQGLEIFAH